MIHRARFSVLLLLLGLLAVASYLLTRSPRHPVASSASPVIGQVRDDSGPVAGARVRFKGELQSLLTDAQGRFRLPPRPGPSARVTAWKDGYFIAGARADLSPLRLTLTALPTEDCERYAWVDPTPDRSSRHNCGNCHEEIYREWAGSGHARAAAGRRFRNLYDGSDWDGRPGAGWSLLAEHPDGAGACTACHAPTVPPGDPAYFDLRQVRGVAALGVHCDLCHKIADAGEGPIGLTHGRFGLKLLRPAEGQLFFGPLDDVDRGEDAYSPLYRDSRYCASCHEGTVFGVHVYGTYSEWLDSPARREGRHCQSCHMAPTGRLTNLAPGKGGIERSPWTLGNHRFFDGSLDEMLRDSLTASIHLSRSDGGTRVDVTVRADRAGHRVPTGFIDRHLLLVVEALGPDGRSLRVVNGPVLPDAADPDLAGQPGRLYGRLLKDVEGRSPAPFWRADPAFVDTRLFPGKPDLATFVFPAELDHVRVRLLYRRFWHEVARAKRWPDNEVVVIDQVARF